MAKVGLFVPAREPVELPWFDFADIGDECWSRVIYVLHIRRISQILSEMNSLVLLDEVGAGTDPVEGSAIALLQYLGDHAQLSIYNPFWRTEGAEIPRRAV